jgi:hypothetical protein
MAEGVRSFEGVRVESVDWPIVVIDCPEQRVQDSALHDALLHLESLLQDAQAAREKVFVISDLTRMREVTPASQRKYTAEWMKRSSALLQDACVGGAHVTPSAMLRGIITAVFWLSPPPTPQIFVATRAEAVSHGVGMLEAAGQLLAPQLLKLRDAYEPRR